MGLGRGGVRSSDHPEREAVCKGKSGGERRCRGAGAVERVRVSARDADRPGDQTGVSGGLCGRGQEAGRLDKQGCSRALDGGQGS